MPEPSPSPSSPAPSASLPSPRPCTGAATRSFRGRIGSHPSSGFYAAPHRYRIFLSRACPDGLRIAVTHDLLGLADRLPMTLLPAVPDQDGGYAALRTPYETSWHGYDGVAAEPLLVDGWTGRIVSNHAPHILRDLATRFRDHQGPELHPRAADGELRALAELLDDRVNEAAQRAGQAGAAPEATSAALAVFFGALDELERRLTGRTYLLGESLTAADVHLWVTLVQLDTVHRWHLDAGAVERLAAYRALWAHARRLLSLPAFRTHLDRADILRRHRLHCRGQEAAGAAVQIIDWSGVHDLAAPLPHD